MAVFVPFKGVRYNLRNTDLSKNVCPPFDVINSRQREELIGASPDNIVSVELPAGDSNRYSAAADKLDRMMSSGLLSADADDSFYIIRTEFSLDGAPMTVESITGRLKLEPFGGMVLPHEYTRSADKQDRLELMKATAANISPVYTLVDDSSDFLGSVIRQAAESEPAAAASFDGMVHSVYTVSGQTAAEISGFFADKPLIIADGHHRYETALAYKSYRESLGEVIDENHPAGYIMTSCAAARQPGLIVMPTHRVVTWRDGFSSQALLEQCGSEFEVIPVERDSAALRLADCYNSADAAFLYYDGDFSLIRKKPGEDLSSFLPDKSEAYRNLDLSALHSVILSKHLGIDDAEMTAGTSLIYTRDFNEVVALVDSRKACCAFIVNPTKVLDVMKVALSGERMPQKSTFFYPKLITGLVINKM